MLRAQLQHGRTNLARGFTLIEIVIVLVIASIVLAAIVSLARPYFEERIRQQTVNSVRSVEKGLADYLERVGAYEQYL
jgi:prepilin-type N-terminal cleavage/methylation domain-containing protein